MPLRRTSLKKITAAYLLALIAVFAACAIMEFPRWEVAQAWLLLCGVLLVVPLTLITYDLIGERAPPAAGPAGAEQGGRPRLGQPPYGSMSACGAMMLVVGLVMQDQDVLPRELNEALLAVAMLFGPVFLLAITINLILSLRSVIRGPALHRRHVGLWWGAVLVGAFLPFGDRSDPALPWLVLQGAYFAGLAIAPGVWLYRQGADGKPADPRPGA